MYFLGFQVRQTNSGTFISQAKYARNSVNKSGLGSTKNRGTLIWTHDKITQDKTENGIDQILYRSMIGSLLYLTASHPNICYSVSVSARYQTSPKDSHLLVFKKIIKYVSKTAYYGL